MPPPTAAAPTPPPSPPSTTAAASVITQVSPNNPTTTTTGSLRSRTSSAQKPTSTDRSRRISGDVTAASKAAPSDGAAVATTTGTARQQQAAGGGGQQRAEGVTKGAGSGTAEAGSSFAKASANELGVATAGEEKGKQATTTTRSRRISKTGSKSGHGAAAANGNGNAHPDAGATSATAASAAVVGADPAVADNVDPSNEKSSRQPRRPTKVKSGSVKSKHSFWSSFVSAILPCVSSSRTRELLDDDDDSSGGSAAAQKKKEKAAARSAEAQANAQAGDSSAAAGGSSSGKHAGMSEKSLTAITIPTSNKPTTAGEGEPVVVVPPSPKTHLLPTSETEGVTSGAVQPPGSTGPQHASSHDEEVSDRSSSHVEEDSEMEPEEDDTDRLIRSGGAGIPVGPDGQPRPLLPPITPEMRGKKLCVLDLDETLVHSSFKLIPQADYVVPVEIEWQWHNVYVIKRPGVDNFLKRMGELYEVVVFTASLSKYADPVLDKLDIHKVVTHRLFRESCYNHKGNYVKDLSQLGRPIQDTIILDNSPASYIFHPNNAVPVSSWFSDIHDTELADLTPFLADLATVDDVRGVLDGSL